MDVDKPQSGHSSSHGKSVSFGPDGSAGVTTVFAVTPINPNSVTPRGKEIVQELRARSLGLVARTTSSLSLSAPRPGGSPPAGFSPEIQPPPSSAGPGLALCLATVSSMDCSMVAIATRCAADSPSAMLKATMDNGLAGSSASSPGLSAPLVDGAAAHAVGPVGCSPVAPKAMPLLGVQSP
jgi:hypothetical protein